MQKVGDMARHIPFSKKLSILQNQFFGLASQ